MFAKRLIQKATQHHHRNHPQVNGCVTSADLNFRIAVHYGIPSTASVLAFDYVQRLLAIGTLDGRIKVIGGDNIEGILISPKQLPHKYLEFLLNQGYLVSISNDDDIQVWDLENRCIACSLQWESNITAFSVVQGSHFMYVGDEYGSLSVLKFEAEDGQLLLLPYFVSASSLSEAAGLSFLDHQPIVGVLPQPCSSGNRQDTTAWSTFTRVAESVIHKHAKGRIDSFDARNIIVLIAYANGLIILWDIVEARAVIIRGDKVLEVKDAVADIPSGVIACVPDDTSEQNLGEKEISALCWASCSGSILAVGYIDGDILFWRTSTPASNKGQRSESLCNSVVKLQLSSAQKRIPVIVLQWSANSKSQTDGGQLFIYGGDEIGSDEVLTVLSLEWSSGMETLTCLHRMDLTLSGSFADMILLPTSGATMDNENAALFVLTNPGQLHFLDRDSFSAFAPQQDKKASICPAEYPLFVPTVAPTMNVAKLSLVSPTGDNSSKALLEIATQTKCGSTQSLAGSTKWPLTGGVANQLSSAEDYTVERVYIAGYKDGSVRIWDATFPVLSLLCILESEFKGIEVAGSSASVLTLDFCPFTLCLVVGNECGLVRLYYLGRREETSFLFVTETKVEVHSLPQEKGFNCRAVFGLRSAPVKALEFASDGAKLAVGYECGSVAVLDTRSLSVSFLSNFVSKPSSPVISIMWNTFMLGNGDIQILKHSQSKTTDNPAKEFMFVLTQDARVYVVDGGSGNVVNSQPMRLKKDSNLISMYRTRLSSLSYSIKSSQTSRPGKVQPGLSLLKTLTLVVLIHMRLKITLSWNICSHKEAQGIHLFYFVAKMNYVYTVQNLWFRSLPDLELVEETSLMSILRWNFKANMDRTMSSMDNGQISLANGCELAFISLLTCETDFRVPESLPLLHDKVLAAAAMAAIGFSSNQKKKQGTAPGILGGFVKGFKGGKVKNTMDPIAKTQSNFSHLEGIFLRNPFPDPPPTTTTNQESLDLDIDDIEIDEPVSTGSASVHAVHNNERQKRTERERLFGGEGADEKPRLRTREEIIATYRKAGDASSVAGQARNKLLERQEKLEKISQRTEELRNGAEDFASLANELVKTLEHRKWWQI
ncbi:hypothetical protein RJ639_004531 [Escallonia herrerae]|uniref:V-SNARE coiled-coil homology domain-containing protein n=1 Tax=Escallonia herrerae TaxID=1293975 RepID=A0AA88VYX5_9ASTE|nr:hypothetical protein RJ639_004531 [Escallonia herrerae]